MSRAIFSLAALVCVMAPSIVHCEPKRDFYTNDLDSVAVPGTNNVASPAQSELAARLVINGVTVRTSPQVESVFHTLRQTVFDVYKSTSDYLNDGKSKVYSVERKVTGTVSSLHNKSEDLFPNAIYIVIGGLSGSIAARRRGIMARALLPVVFGVGAFWYFLPVTFANTAGFLWKVEQRTMPAVAASQIAAVESAESLVEKVELSARSGRASVTSSVASLRERVAAATGLNLDEEVTRK